MHEEICIPNEIKYINQTSSKVLAALKGKGLDESRLFDIRLSAEEAIRSRGEKVTIGPMPMSW